ncbi:MAG TPA: polymer-forming cytoskeletal protein [Thiotrichaceae bacterium]|nr:polymer-forming cytoskeletal protein [Thiotrichaceae bacterium]HIM07349.1 polymer-forming cytoskeletal protein [Gammaproteobacteria bacterium]
MFGNSKNRKATRIDTLVGQHTEIQGDIRFSGGLHIDGTVKGNVIAENDGRSMVSLSECGTIEGELNVPYVVLNGVVIGDVHSSEHVELASKARITGNVYYNLIEMAIGAEVNGKLVHSLEPADSPLALGHGEPLEVGE